MQLVRVTGIFQLSNVIIPHFTTTVNERMF